MISAIFERFVDATPLTVMVRAIMERSFAPEQLEKLVSLFIRARQKRKNRVTLHKGFKRSKFGARIIHDTN